MSKGAFCLVLHGHLPWVLHHGRWPHGEDWLFEAASATWMPLLEVLDTCREEGIYPGWTLGLTPILLEQLGHARFKEGFAEYLLSRAARARSDQAEFRGQGRLHLAWLAERHEARAHELLQAFDRIDRNIPRALAEAHGVELLSSNATHGFMPMILHDACARAQVRAGFATSRRHLGHQPAGMWLPECAYRPGGSWWPPAVHGDERHRQGVANIASNEGCRYFFVDTHLVEGAHPRAFIQGEHVHWLHDAPDGMSGFRSVLEPHRVVEHGEVTGVSVMGRCPDVSEQVWSGEVGYPGDGRYREFHKLHGMRGLPYWKVTRGDAALHEKDPYYPDDIPDAVRAHAKHFVNRIRNRLAGHHGTIGRWGAVCAPFDAELFGHWWHEGPAFLLEVARAMREEFDVEAMTVGDYLSRAPADKAAELPAGTWGAGGDTRVWFNDELRFYWDIAYRAEDRFLDLWHRVDWRGHGPGTEWLTEAARQLLLLQSSDWPFVIHTKGAVDYGMRRILDHAARFDDLCNGAEDALGGKAVDPVVQQTLERCRLVDPVFPDLDLGWWS